MNLLQITICALMLILTNGLEIRPRIINGTRVQPGEFPWHTSLALNETEIICGGTILSPNWVLSAAHCLEGIDSIILIFGTIKRNYRKDPNTVERNSTKIYRHPDFDIKEYHNDVSLIKFDDPIEYNEYIQPVTLIPRTKAKEKFVGEKGIVVGMGWYDDENEEGLKILNKANVKILNNKECKDEFEGVICTDGFDDANRSTCKGDSGGELLFRDENENLIQIGVASFIFTENCANLPNGFARLSEYLDYIENTTGLTLS